MKQCGDCVNATVCNKVNGYCSLGCDIGFKSPLCQEGKIRPPDYRGLLKRF